MCTLTFTDPEVGDADTNATPGDYRAWFNRDERLSRGAEIPPSEARTPDGVCYLAPTDSDAGGTWFAVNEFGVTIALLNGYSVSKGETKETYISRGALVRDLANLRTTRDAWARLSPRELTRYRPAVVAVIAPGEAALLARWNGLDVAINPNAVDELPISSSSFEQEDVIDRRRKLFDTLVGLDVRAATAESLAHFQAFVDPEVGPTAYTPSMSRPDAATRSQVSVHVQVDKIELDYIAGPPHDQAAPRSTFALPRNEWRGSERGRRDNSGEDRR